METSKKTNKAKGRPRVNELTRELVGRLYDEDKMSVKEIAQSVNIGEASVYRIIRERRYVYEQKENTEVD